MPGPRAATEPRLSRDEIVAAARLLVAEEGIEALTMRRVAEQCGIQGPTLYWHFRDKDDLLGHLLDSVVADLDVGSDDQPWPARLEVVAGSYRRLLVEHRGLAGAIASRFSGTETVLGGFEVVLGVLLGAGFTHRQAVAVHYAVVTYTTGFALYEGASPVFRLAAEPPGAPERVAGRTLLQQFAEGRFPRLAELAPVLDEITTDELFHTGLRSLVAGFEAMLQK